MTDRELDRQRGQRAELLLNDDLLKEAFDTIEAEYIKAWVGSPPRDTEGRERVWQAVQIVGRVKTHLQSVAATGRLSAKELDDLAKLEKKSHLRTV